MIHFFLREIRVGFRGVMKAIKNHLNSVERKDVKLISRKRYNQKKCLAAESKKKKKNISPSGMKRNNQKSPSPLFVVLVR